MNRIGLVFAGGGGKGAYQIGVWKYLKECGLDEYICAVSGTSVGALNATLFTTCDYSVAESIWLNIQPEQILTPRELTLEDVIGTLAKWGITASIPQLLIGGVTIPFLPIVTAIQTTLSKRHGFSREGLLKIMDKYVDFGKMYESDRPCFATCFDIAGFRIERFKMSDYTEKDMKDILLASSAIPVVFEPVKIQGKNYYDGGLPLIGDNVPIQPLYDAGVENIIVVHLSRDTCIDKEKYKGSRLIEIIPQVDLGGPIDGTLDFTGSGSAWRLEQGYRDAKRMFGTFVEVAKIRKMNQILFQAFQKSEKRYNEEKARLKTELNEIYEQRRSDGFDEMCKSLGIN